MKSEVPTRVSVREGLATAQVRRYEAEGYLSPLPVLSADEVAGYHAALMELEDFAAGLPRPTRSIQPHLFFRWAYELATHPRVLDAVEEIIGADILVHTTSIFCKRPREKSFVSWHQDGFYWRLSAPKLVSAWIALTESTVENGCLRVIPRTQQRVLPHTQRRHEQNMLTSGLTVEAELDEAAAVDIVLRPGEMSLHHVNLVHGSSPNSSDTWRIGFAVRYVSPDVSQELPHHQVVLARGRDDFHHYELFEGTPDSSPAEGLASQAGLEQAGLKLRNLA
jgi:non-haem Fe2+, alpha-ketoglutarate-dependent halogenase